MSAGLSGHKVEIHSTASARDSFDIILVLEYFRSAAPYLSIVKYLSAQYRIGIYLAPTEQAMIKKNGSAHRRFVKKCIELGAELVKNKEVDCRLMIVQQRPYPEEVATKIMNQIQAKRRVGYLALAAAGVDTHDQFLEQFQIDRVYVPNRRFFDYLLRHRKSESTYANVDVEQVGLPFDRYPIFPDFNVDYLVASPTLFSFHSEHDKHTYLRNVLSLLSEIGAEASVAYKPHNGQGRDSLRRRGYTELGALFARIPFAEDILERFLRTSKQFIGRGGVEKTLTGLLYARLRQRVIPMNQLTLDNEFALELFMMGTQRGVIGGLSNTIWGTLYFGRDYYNCVDGSVQNRGKENSMLRKDSSGLLDLNLGFFCVPCCHGKLQIFSESQSIVTECDRHGDLLRSIQADL